MMPPAAAPPKAPMTVPVLALGPLEQEMREIELRRVQIRRSFMAWRFDGEWSRHHGV
jgi:hypothetical protein